MLGHTPQHAKLARRDDILGGAGSIITGLIPGAGNTDTGVLSASPQSDPSLSLPTLPTIPLTGLPSISNLPIPLPPVLSNPESSSNSATSSTSATSPKTPTRSSSAVDSTRSTASTHSEPSTPSTSGQPSLSDFTATLTSTSGTIVVTVTTIVRPSASLASAPNSDSDFFHNKAQVGVVFTIIALLAICLFGFLGYRFLKTVKARKLERDSEDAIRSMNYRVGIDDDDDNAGPSNMTEVRNPQTYGERTFDFLQGGGSSTEGRHSSETTNYTPSLHSSSHHLLNTPIDSTFRQTFSDDYSHSPVSPVADTGHAVNRRSRSNTVGSGSDTIHRTLSASTSQSHKRLYSDTIHRMPSTSSTFQSHKRLHIPHEPLPPSRPLPEKFGEDGNPEWDGDEDEYGRISLGRVLKVANE